MGIYNGKYTYVDTKVVTVNQLETYPNLAYFKDQDGFKYIDVLYDGSYIDGDTMTVYSDHKIMKNRYNSFFTID